MPAPDSPYVVLVKGMRAQSAHAAKAGVPLEQLIFRLRPDAYECFVLGSIDALDAMGQWDDSASVGGFDDIPVIEDESVVARSILHRCGLKGGVE